MKTAQLGERTMNKLYYFFNINKGSWRAVTKQDFNEMDCEDCEVPCEVTRLSDDEYHLRCDVYYGSGGYIELRVTRPLTRALAIFAGLMIVDEELERAVANDERPIRVLRVVV
jgi:hypothetical protein